MRSRMVGAVVAALAVGALVGAASAAAATVSKPKLWLRNPIGSHRATAGEEMSVELKVEQCTLDQSAKLLANGMPVDHIVGSAAPTIACPAGYKLAGNSKEVNAAAAGTPTFPAAAMTFIGALHVMVEPWCVYALPSRLSLPLEPETASVATFTAPLDKAASFGSCAATRAVEVRLVVRVPLYLAPYEAEVVG